MRPELRRAIRNFSLNWTNVVLNLLILFTPIAVIISGVAAVRGIRQDSANRRNRLSLAAIIFIFAAAALWTIVRTFAPPLPLQSDPAYIQALNRAHKYIETWRWVAFAFCISGLVCSVLGRLRLVLPVMIAASGTAVFWWISTAWP